MGCRNANGLKNDHAAVALVSSAVEISAPLEGKQDLFCAFTMVYMLSLTDCSDLVFDVPGGTGANQLLQLRIECVISANGECVPPLLSTAVHWQCRKSS